MIIVIDETNLDVFREYRAFQEFTMCFVSTLAQRFNTTVIDFEGAYRFRENRFRNAQFQVQIHNDHLNPFGWALERILTLMRRGGETLIVGI
jgi:hypothetical protein